MPFSERSQSEGCESRLSYTKHSFAAEPQHLDQCFGCASQRPISFNPTAIACKGENLGEVHSLFILWDSGRGLARSTEK